MILKVSRCPKTGRKVYKVFGMDVLVPLMLFCLAMARFPQLCVLLAAAFWMFVLLHFQRGVRATADVGNVDDAPAHLYKGIWVDSNMDQDALDATQEDDIEDELHDMLAGF